MRSVLAGIRDKERGQARLPNLRIAQAWRVTLSWQNFAGQEGGLAPLLRLRRSLRRWRRRWSGKHYRRSRDNSLPFLNSERLVRLKVCNRIFSAAGPGYFQTQCPALLRSA